MLRCSRDGNTSMTLSFYTMPSSCERIAHPRRHERQVRSLCLTNREKFREPSFLARMCPLLGGARHRLRGTRACDTFAMPTPETLARATWQVPYDRSVTFPSR